MNVVRDLALLLRPSMLDDFGLVPALNWHAREMSKLRTGLNITFKSLQGRVIRRSYPDEAQDLYLSAGAGGVEQRRAPRQCP